MTRLGSLLLVLATGSVAHAHNGFGIAPIYEQPFGIIVTDGSTPLVIEWTARESHPEQLYRFKVQQGDFPPTPSPASSLRQGIELASLPADALSYSVPLDLSELPSGAWRIYSEHDEPPSCVELEQLPALIVLRRAGDPPPFGVVVTDPVVDSPIVDHEAALSIHAVSPSPVRVTIEAGEIVRDPEWPNHVLCVEFLWTPTLGTIAEDVPLVAAGDGMWTLDYDWDTRAVPDGAYLLRVTAETDDGQTQVIWARRWFNVEHPRVVVEEDAAVEASAEAGAEAEAREGAAEGGGCAGAGASGSLLALLALLQGFASSRSR